jgi:hypothetical protein
MTDTTTNTIGDELVIQACREWREPPHTGSLARLQHLTGLPADVCAAAMVASRGRGLIEWGVTMESAWPTPAGDQLFGQQHTRM